MARKSEGGSGGKRGHSNMSHWATTAEVKDEARKVRRGDDAREARATLEVDEFDPANGSFMDWLLND